MGINWSDIFYPGNPGRRDEVNKLVESIRTSVDQLFGNVRTMSKTLNKACSKFQVLDPLDLSITYAANLKKLQAVIAQWESATKEMEMDPSIPQEIKDLMRKFEDLMRKFQEPTSVGQLPGPAFNPLDIIGNTGVGELVDTIVGAIEGDSERTELEELKREYTALDKNFQADLDALEDGVADVIHAIIKAIP